MEIATLKKVKTAESAKVVFADARETETKIAAAEMMLNMLADTIEEIKTDRMIARSREQFVNGQKRPFEAFMKEFKAQKGI